MKMKKFVFITTVFLLIAKYGVNAQNGTQPHPHIKNQDKDQSMVVQEKMNNGVFTLGAGKFWIKISL